MSHTVPALLLALLVAFAPLALAHPDDEPYYVRADAHPPQGPEEWTPKRDCAGPDAARDPRSSATFVASQVRPNETKPNGSVEHLVPTCVAFDTGTPAVCMEGVCIVVVGMQAAGPHGRLTYETTSGNYTLMLLPGFAYSGNSGIGAEFDCRECPPPDLLA